MIPTAIAFLAGQLLAGWFSFTWGLCGFGVGVWVIVGRGFGRAEQLLRRIAIVAVGGALASAALRPPGGDCFLPPPGLRTKLWLLAEIVETPRLGSDRTRFVVRAREDRRKGQAVCGRVRLTLEGRQPSLRTGDRLRLHARIGRPRNFGNPGSHDAVGALARDGIWVTGSVAPETLVRRSVTENLLVRARAAVRKRIRRAIRRTLAPPEAGLARALVLGESHAVDPALRDRMERTGTSHLLAISGLHVGIVWGATHVVVLGLLRRSEALLLRSNVHAWAAMGALGPTVLYAVVAGGRVATQRAVTMAALFVVALAFGREVTTFRTVALAAVLLAIARPGVVAEPGFQLSFTAVLGVVLSLRGRRPGRPFREYLRLLFRTALFATVATMPLTAFHFNRVSPAGLVVNPFVIPLIAAPGTVLAIAGAAATLLSETVGTVALRAAGLFLAVLDRTVEVASGSPMASFRVPTPSVAELGLLYGLASVGWLHRRRRWPVAAICLLLLTLDASWWVRERWWREDVRIRFLDVGQGDAAVLELPRGRVVVIDGGGFRDSRFDTGEHILAPYLWSRKILHVDVLVASHGDRDHQGGLSFLAQEFRPAELWRSADAREASRLERLESLVRDGGGHVRILRPGGGERFGQASFRCLHPPAEGQGSSNDRSLVLLLRAGAATVLFSGDVEARAERALVGRIDSSWRDGVDVLKVPHHGSSSSSSLSFVRTVRPGVAIVSAGAGFPSPNILDRYRRIGARLYRTSRDGSVLVRIGADGSIGARPYRLVPTPFCSGFGVC